MESSKGESEKSQSIKLNVILSVPPLFYILYPPLEPFCHPPPFRQKGAFLSYRKLCFHTIKKLRLGCALGAGVDGCRSNRASVRECAKAHSFFLMGFILLRVLEFFVFRKMEMPETKNHLLCGWRQSVVQKNHLSVTIELFRHYCKKGKVILWRIRIMI